MTFETPLKLTGRKMNPLEEELARKGRCSDCGTQTLQAHHTSRAIEFFRCTQCEGFVALDRP